MFFEVVLASESIVSVYERRISSASETGTPVPVTMAPIGSKVATVNSLSSRSDSIRLGKSHKEC